jgi:hypothetical protein
MTIRKTFFLLILVLTSHFHGTATLAEQFSRKGYSEIRNTTHGTETFDWLYLKFDEMIDFLHAHPNWAHKLYVAKERFIRSSGRDYYSTDMFGFYDESDRKERRQISFYYSLLFHEYLSVHFSAFFTIPEISRFFEACQIIHEPYGKIIEAAAVDLRLEGLFAYEQPPILLKVIKYLPSYAPSKPHYDGTAFSLFLDSTDNELLLMSPYKSSLSIDDFSAPAREFPRGKNGNSLLLIPGAQLAEFSIFPTPHIVLQSGTIRYAAIAFAMRPHYSPKKIEFTPLPNFKH